MFNKLLRYEQLFVAILLTLFFFSQEHQRVENKDANGKVLLKTFRLNGLTLRFEL